MPKVVRQTDRFGIRIFIIKQINDGNSADPGNGFAEPDQFISVEFIGPAKAVNDFGHRFAGVGMPFIVGQLVILNNRAVFIFPTDGSQVHAS